MLGMGCLSDTERAAGLTLRRRVSPSLGALVLAWVPAEIDLELDRDRWLADEEEDGSRVGGGEEDEEGGLPVDEDEGEEEGCLLFGCLRREIE